MSDPMPTIFLDDEGQQIEAPTEAELAEIISEAERTLQQDTCTDHPCEFHWAEKVLKVAAFYEHAQKVESNT